VWALSRSRACVQVPSVSIPHMFACWAHSSSRACDEAHGWLNGKLPTGRRSTTTRTSPGKWHACCLRVLGLCQRAWPCSELSAQSAEARVCAKPFSRAGQLHSFCSTELHQLMSSSVWCQAASDVKRLMSSSVWCQASDVKQRVVRKVLLSRSCTATPLRAPACTHWHSVQGGGLNPSAFKTDVVCESSQVRGLKAVNQKLVLNSSDSLSWGMHPGKLEVWGSVVG